MTRYHISLAGAPAVCKASSDAACPLGGNHFRTRDEAEMHQETVKILMDEVARRARQESINDVNRVATRDKAEQFLQTELGGHFREHSLQVAENGSSFTLRVDEPFSYGEDSYRPGDTFNLSLEELEDLALDEMAG